MKFSLFSASSIIALLAVSMGTSNATPIAAARSPLSLSDLTPEDTGAPVGLPVAAIQAIESVVGGLGDVSSTGRTVRIRVPGAEVPLSAARGVRDDDDAVTTVIGFWTTDIYQKALALGRSRVAPLIGSIGDGGMPGQKLGGSVFVSVASAGVFIDSSAFASRSRGGPVAAASAAGGTSTTAITVAGANNQRSPTVPFVSTAHSPQTTAPIDGEASQVLLNAGQTRPPAAFIYAPNPVATMQSTVSFASFSDAVGTANATPQATRTRQTETLPAAAAKAEGARVELNRLLEARLDARRDKVTPQPKPDLPAGTTAPRIASSLVPATRTPPTWGVLLDRFQTGQLEQAPPIAAQPVTVAVAPDIPQRSERLAEQLRPVQLKTAAGTPRAGLNLNLTPATDRLDSGKAPSGPTATVSTSVSVDPKAIETRKLLSNLDAGATTMAARSVEAFYVGEASVRVPLMKSSTVSIPLQDKIVASAGALNNALALP